MNEKIKLLAEQAALNAVTKNFNGTSVEVQVPSENWAKEFAELIIKETLQVARAGIEYGPSMEEVVYKYFGVEL